MKTGSSSWDSCVQSRAGDTRPVLTWQLLAKPVPSGDARAGSGSDIGLLSVQEREREKLRVGEAEIERQRGRQGEGQR